MSGEGGLFGWVDQLVQWLVIGIPLIFVGGHLLADYVRSRNLLWTWVIPGVPVGLLLSRSDSSAGLLIAGVCARAWRLGHRWHNQDLQHGADLGEAARARLSISALLERYLPRHTTRPQGWLRGRYLVIGRDRQGRDVCIPFGRTSGAHTLIVGATGSGKTVSETWIACRLIEAGHGAVVIDPKGDELLHDALQHQASLSGREFLEWTPEGPLSYNPYASGTHSEITDKALAGETFTEPHYLRQAQRYLAHAVRAMYATGIQVTPVSLMGQLDPKRLDVTARSLPEEHADELQAYLDSLDDRQRRELGGVRDRLSILAESDIHQWLEPTEDRTAIDLRQAVADRAVVYFRLDADRRVLLSRMVASAIVLDLVTLTAELQHSPVPTVVVIDEFSAIAPDTVARLFGRGCGAGISLILASQELADIRTASEGLLEQVQGNITTLIAHRQTVPDSAELIAATAGTRPAWITTQQTGHNALAGAVLTGSGSRTRGHEYAIHPSRIKELTTGHAAVITPGQAAPTIARIHHPHEAHDA